MMTKVDFKKLHSDLYRPSVKKIEVVEVPEFNFVKVNGAGPPGNDAYADACAWLFSTSYGLKFLSKNTLAKDYVVMPLEGLWWADDFTAYADNRRDEWLWTLMIMQPDWITQDMFQSCLEKAAQKLGDMPASLRFETYNEGLSVQTLHLGPFADEAPTIARMHDQFIPENGLVLTGHHHEIYLSDPRKTAPEKLRTVLRQPVARQGD